MSAPQTDQGSYATSSAQVVCVIVMSTTTIAGPSRSEG
jgi:hypothetical protein